jgi:hypothetical protein
MVGIVQIDALGAALVFGKETECQKDAVEKYLKPYMVGY